MEGEIISAAKAREEAEKKGGGDGLLTR